MPMRMLCITLLFAGDITVRVEINLGACKALSTGKGG